MTPSGLHVDYFSGALGELPKKLHGDDEAVLACLREHPRFSVFDVDRNLGVTLNRLKQCGRLEYDARVAYPWCVVAVLPEPLPCTACNGRGSHQIIGRHYKVCRSCAGNGWCRLPVSERREGTKP